MNKVNKDTLYYLYVVQEKSMNQIATELGVAVGTVYNYMKRYGFSSRERYKGFLGKKHTQEVKAIISQKNKNKNVSELTRKKMSESTKVGGIGHKKKRSDGYIAVYFPDHPKSTSDGYIMEHVLVMECVIGRWLHDDEVVHHKNGKKNDNRKENLQLMTFREHAGFHMKERHTKKKGGMTYQ